MSEQIDIDINVNTNNAEELDELASSLNDATSNAEELNDSLASVSSGNLNESSSDADELSSSLDGAANSSDGLADSMGILNGGMLMGIGQQIQGIGTNAEGMAQQMNTASISVGQLATNTGVAEPKMVDLVNHISNATFPQNEAMAYVGALQQMGVSADKLGDSATNMDRINDATGMGYTNVMQLTQGLRSVGVSADNLPSAFNAIAFAQSNVNGGAATLSQVFKRQAATINEYGLSVDQTVLIMQKLSEQGVQGMKMGSELSNVLKENNGDISAIEQSLGMASGALTNASATTGQYEGKLQTLANEELEHKTLLQQVGAAWEDVSLKMSGFLSPLGSVIGGIGQLGSFGMTIKGLREIGSTLMGVRGAMSTARLAMDALRNSESITEGVRAALAIATGAEATAEGGSAAAKTAAIAPTTGLAIAENSLLWPLLLIVGAVIAVIGVMWYLYNTNETVRNGINWLIAQIQGFIAGLQPVVNAIMGFATAIGNSIGKIPGIIKNALMIALAVIAPWTLLFTNEGRQAIMKFVNIIGSTLGTLRNIISNALSGVVDAITKPFRDAWDMVKPYVDKIKEGIDFINPFKGFEGFGDYDNFKGYAGVGETLNGTISSISNSSTNNTMTVNNNFNGIVEESAADYIVNAVNDRLRREKLLKGA